MNPFGKTWTRDPLIHFILIGALLFAGYRWWGPDPRHTVEISRTGVNAMASEIRQRTGREPDAAEMQAAIDRYVEEEVLYREALALGLDRGDVIVRRRLVQKMEFLTEDLAAPHEPATKELQDFWVDHPENYQTPARYSFQHVYIDSGRHAAPAQVAARIGKSLTGPALGANLGDPFLRGNQFTRQSAVQIADVFGPGFASLLADVAPGAWVGPLASSFGLHWVYLGEKLPSQAAPLKDVQDRVRTDWRLARQKEANRAALLKLRAGYDVRVEGEAR